MHSAIQNWHCWLPTCALKIGAAPCLKDCCTAEMWNAVCVCVLSNFGVIRCHLNCALLASRDTDLASFATATANFLLLPFLIRLIGHRWQALAHSSRQLRPTNDKVHRWSEAIKQIYHHPQCHFGYLCLCLCLHCPIPTCLRLFIANSRKWKFGCPVRCKPPSRFVDFDLKTFLFLDFKTFNLHCFEFFLISSCCLCFSFLSFIFGAHWHH